MLPNSLAACMHRVIFSASVFLNKINAESYFKLMEYAMMSILNACHNNLYVKFTAVVQVF